MRFRPCIDLHRGRVKQIVGATYRDADEGLVTNFDTDRPARAFAEMYRSDGLTGGHVIMLGPGNEDAALSALSAFPGGLQVGGGITPENAARFLDAGASHVIVTSYVFREGVIDWKRLEAMVQAVGGAKLVLDLSCKKFDNRYLVVTDRWQRVSNVAIDRELLDGLAESCDELLVHAAHVEGRREGVDTALVELLAASAPLPVTYAGGIRSLEDLDTISEAGDGRIDATVGSALDIFGGSLPYREVVAWHHRHAGPSDNDSERLSE
ncbi:MAG: phosphoribosylformimino-5-aminoimidazole carboxamide ribotide isomerase [Chitinivibrionales bacterium]|nr:phosphoribosylformimino-5-aminoimidazole carboxamide ribotide isomerase [Chitinivibrionales bacterium]